jgi:hypothetical protein
VGTDSSVAITAGSGTSIDTFAKTDGQHQQIVRLAQGDTVTTNAWAASTTAATSVVAADINRLMVLILNNSTGRVYLRFDATAPTTATNGHHLWLDPGDMYECPVELATLAVSMLAATVSGHVVSTLVTEA